MKLLLGIAIVTVLALVFSILFFPSVKIKGVSLGTYWMVAFVGCVILVCTGCIDFVSIGEGLTNDSAINPIKILILFLSMTLQSVFLDELGLFRYLASAVLRKAGKRQDILFLALYGVVSVLTVFTSNDIIILTFTPFICYFCKNAKINPIPFLFTEFVAANTWSMALIIGNPTNVYLATSGDITFLAYTEVMLIPTIMAGLVSLIMLYLVFHKSLSAPILPGSDEYKVEDKPLLIIGIIHLSACTIMLVISSYVGLEMWLITMLFALSLLAISTVYLLIRKKKPVIIVSCLKRLPWELIPFVISMFIFVLAFDKAALTSSIGHLLDGGEVIINYGVFSFLTANLVNNIPMSVLFSSVVKSLPEVNFLKGLFASIVGSNIGAFFTPIGALAGIMWTGILKKHGVGFRFTTYIKYGMMISVPTLMAALLGLMIVNP